mmetsp:Transcript_34231/g.107420  ORF Transcript_34231/g.107420 Transcript_34231/m.107420 type:complete len:452 (+) Transcript_34231:158-1513(+)
MALSYQPKVWNPYEKDFGEQGSFRHGTALERRFAPRWPLLSARLNCILTQVCTASTDKTVRVHDVATGKQVRRFVHPDVVRFACFSPDGDWVCTACDDCFARVFSIETEEELFSLQHRSRMSSACFSPDGFLLCTGSKDRTARIFAVKDNPLSAEEEEEQLSDKERALAILEKARREAAEAKARIVAEEMKKPPEDRFRNLDPEDRWRDDPDFATGARWGRLGDWYRRQEEPPEEKDAEETPPTPIPRCVGDPPIILTHDNAVLAVGFDADVKRVCTGTGASRFFGVATVWDLELQKEANIFDTHEDAVTAVQFNTEGSLLVTASRDKTARLWNLEEKRDVASFHHANWVSSAELSPDGQWVCTGCEDGYARIWDVKSRKELIKLKHAGPVTHACFGLFRPPEPEPSEPGAEPPKPPPAKKPLVQNREPPALPVCTAAADGVARVFGVRTN